MMRRPPLRSRAGTRLAFTLIELLTVISIIALLISILLPSLGRVRINAKRTASKALLHAIDTGLELFRTETGEYPESSLGLYYGDASAQQKDSINGLELTGAQKLARALMGPEAIKIGSVPPKTLRGAAGSTDSFYTDPSPAQRVGPFMQQAQSGTHYLTVQQVRDRGTAGEPTGIKSRDAAVFIDTFKYPILYWKSEGRGSFMAQALRGGSDTGYYYQEDNLAFLEWSFVVNEHEMKLFGDPLQPDQMPAGVANTFSRAIHPHSPEAENLIGALAKLRKPFNPDTFLLISPGPDGIYGTKDDVTNFGR